MVQVQPIVLWTPAVLGTGCLQTSDVYVSHGKYLDVGHTQTTPEDMFVKYLLAWLISPCPHVIIISILLRVVQIPFKYLTFTYWVKFIFNKVIERYID